jgi:coenzyme F420 hydrogenase subunit beta
MTVSAWTPEAVVKADFCIGCGLCQAMLGKDTIELRENGKGLNEPVEKRPLTETEIAQFGTYCPGARMSAPEPAGDAPSDPMWGNMRLARRAHAADPETRFRSASGGALTALSRHLLTSGMVAFVQHVRPDPDRALHSVAWRSVTLADLAEGSGSRYAPTTPLLAFEEALSDGRPFAFVGRPCDVMAIRQLARVDDRVNARCRYLLTFMCGGTSEFQITTRQLDDWGTREEDLASFSWRGQGCPGPVLARKRDGEELRGTYFSLYGKDESAWGLFLRCKLCPDAIGLSADVVASDCWPGGAPEADDRGDPVEDAGFNYLIARTPAGEDLVRAAVSAGDLVLEGNELCARDFDDVQPHQLTKRHAAVARFEGISETAPVPILEPGLRLDELSLPEGEEYDSQKEGAARRYANR